MSNSNGQRNEADEAFREAIRLLQQGRGKEAAALLEPLYKQIPNNVELALNLGGAYILQRRYNKAEVLLSKAAEQEPENANIWINLAAARLGALEISKRSQQEGAIEAYQKALAIDPEAANVHYMLGLVYHRRKETLRAEAHFRRALEQNPNDQHARRMLERLQGES